jgi:hypothetical protein
MTKIIGIFIILLLFSQLIAHFNRWRITKLKGYLFTYIGLLIFLPEAIVIYRLLYYDKLYLFNRNNLATTFYVIILAIPIILIHLGLTILSTKERHIYMSIRRNTSFINYFIGKIDRANYIETFKINDKQPKLTNIILVIFFMLINICFLFIPILEWSYIFPLYLIMGIIMIYFVIKY